MNQQKTSSCCPRAQPLDCNPSSSPAERNSLIKDEYSGKLCHSFKYASVVGMLLYPLGHTRPDLDFIVSQLARFMHTPKKSHDKALKQIGFYLLGAAMKGLIALPKTSLDIDAYPDAVFWFVWYEWVVSPVCTRNSTGFVITVADCPVVWHLKYQTDKSWTMMQAEVIAMATHCHELLPVIDIMKKLMRWLIGK